MADKSASTPLGWLAQALLYGLFALFIGVFSSWPPYRHLASDQALIKLSFNHQGKPVSECRRATEQELAKLPPNMRAPLDCPRERSPVRVTVALDGRLLLDETLPPTGVARDGAASLYRRIAVPAGRHSLRVTLDDDLRRPGEDARAQTVDLADGQVLTIDYRPRRGGIVLS